MAFLVSLCFIPINANKLIPLVEKQVSRELGVDIHIEQLILRVGPYIKLKAPIMHVMYNDGKKFAQLDNVKFYIPWTSFIKDKIVIFCILFRIKSHFYSHRAVLLSHGLL